MSKSGPAGSPAIQDKIPPERGAIEKSAEEKEFEANSTQLQKKKVVVKDKDGKETTVERHFPTLTRAKFKEWQESLKTNYLPLDAKLKEIQGKILATPTVQPEVKPPKVELTAEQKAVEQELALRKLSDQVLAQFSALKIAENEVKAAIVKANAHPKAEGKMEVEVKTEAEITAAIERRAAELAATAVSTKVVKMPAAQFKYDAKFPVTEADKKAALAKLLADNQVYAPAGWTTKEVKHVTSLPAETKEKIVAANVFLRMRPELKFSDKSWPKIKENVDKAKIKNKAKKDAADAKTAADAKAAADAKVAADAKAAPRPKP